MRIMRNGEWLTYAEAAKATGERAEVWGNASEGFRLMFGGSNASPNIYADMTGQAFRKAGDARFYAFRVLDIRATYRRGMMGPN